METMTITPVATAALAPVATPAATPVATPAATPAPADATPAEGGKKVIKRWINKDGTVVTKEYDQSVYAARHYAKHKEKYTQKHTCECGSDYTTSNKNNHLNTRVHKLYERMSAERTALVKTMLDNTHILDSHMLDSHIKAC